MLPRCTTSPLGRLPPNSLHAKLRCLRTNLRHLHFSKSGTFAYGPGRNHLLPVHIDHVLRCVASRAVRDSSGRRTEPQHFTNACTVVAERGGASHAQDLMSFEVEQKFPVAERPAVEQTLRALGAPIDQPVLQVDQYFSHPSRDFATTDEALRIRRVGEENFVTYKGAKIDTLTKTRREIELPLAPGEQGASSFAQLLMALGFRPVAAVRKRRRRAVVTWHGRPVEVALDEVEQVGSFIELELTADACDVEAAKATLASLAGELGLSKSERRSYLELLLLSSPHP